jgi:hypothetical protein
MKSLDIRTTATILLVVQRCRKLRANLLFHGSSESGDLRTLQKSSLREFERRTYASYTAEQGI